MRIRLELIGRSGLSRELAGRSGQLRGHKPPVNFSLDASYAVCIGFVIAEAYATLAVADPDDTGWVMYAVDDDVAVTSHRSSGNHGNAIELLPAESILGFHQ